MMAWMAAVRFEPIRGPEQISRPIDCFPLCPKILFMQPSSSDPNAAALIFPARQQGALWNNNNKENGRKIGRTTRPVLLLDRLHTAVLTRSAVCVSSARGGAIILDPL